MSALDAVRQMQNQTAWQKSQDAAQLRKDSIDPDNNRNVGGVMGKNDFLMLLTAQLRHQDPLNPQSDGEFASQLAQFSSLEQMQNMNETLTAMAGYQAYSLIGKYVIAETVMSVGGHRELVEIAGIVDAIFTRQGRTYAQIGEFEVLISEITDVFDGSVLLKHEALQQTANNLIGRTVSAEIDEDTIVKGVVTGVYMDKGVMFATIDTGAEEPVIVPVGSIFEIKMVEAPEAEQAVAQSFALPSLFNLSLIDDDDEDKDDDKDDEKKVDGSAKIDNNTNADDGSKVDDGSKADDDTKVDNDTTAGDGADGSGNDGSDGSEGDGSELEP